MRAVARNDELSIAHIRYRLDSGQGHDMTLAENGSLGGVGAREPHREPALAAVGASERGHAFDVSPAPVGIEPVPPAAAGVVGENWLAALAMMREKLPSNVADRCRIQVIIQVPGEGAAEDSSGSGEGHGACPPDSSR